MFAFLFRRFRWMLMGAAARAGVKALGRHRIEEATGDLRNRLPVKAVKVADALPGDVLKAGGSAVVAGQTALRSAQAARQLATAKERAKEKLQSAKDEFGAGIAAEERAYRSDLYRHTRGEAAATDALLDVRALVEEGPLPRISAPVTRRRWRRAQAALPAVQRVQRRYMRPKKAWDLPTDSGF